jgi:hypothetical protein
MRIRYENTVEDLVAFTQYQYAHTPSARRALRVLQCLAVVAALCPAAFREVDGRVPPHWAISVIIAVVAALATPVVCRWAVARQTRRMYGGAASPGVVGPHELELIGDELVERTPVNEMRTALRAVGRVVTEGGYTFIYLTAVMTHVVPHAAVTEGDLQAFMEALKQQLPAERAEPTLHRTAVK